MFVHRAENCRKGLARKFWRKDTFQVNVLNGQVGEQNCGNVVDHDVQEGDSSIQVEGDTQLGDESRDAGTVTYWLPSGDGRG